MPHRGMSLVETAIEAVAPPPIGIAMRLLRWCGGAVKYLLLHPMTLGFIAACLVAVYFQHDAHRWHRKYDASENHFAAYRVGVQQATERNKRAQAAQDADQDTVQDERDRRTHDVQEATERARSSAVDAYAVAHRLPARADCSGPAPAAGVSYDSARPPDQAARGDMVAISRPDLDRLTQDAVQGAVRYQFLQSLIDAGQAVAVLEPPPSKQENPK